MNVQKDPERLEGPGGLPEGELRLFGPRIDYHSIDAGLGTPVH